MTDAFEQALAFVVGHEGGYTAAIADPGNWPAVAAARASAAAPIEASAPPLTRSSTFAR